MLEALDAQSLHQPQVIVGLQQQKKVNNPLKSSLKSLETIQFFNFQSKQDVNLPFCHLCLGGRGDQQLGGFLRAAFLSESGYSSNNCVSFDNSISFAKKEQTHLKVCNKSRLKSRR